MNRCRLCCNITRLNQRLAAHVIWPDSLRLETSPGTDLSPERPWKRHPIMHVDLAAQLGAITGLPTGVSSVIERTLTVSHKSAYFPAVQPMEIVCLGCMCGHATYLGSFCDIKIGLGMKRCTKSQAAGSI